MDFSTTSATVPGVAGTAVILGGSPGTDTIRSDVPRSTASRAAHSTARKDSCEPSAPAITGFVAMLSSQRPSIALLFTQSGPSGPTGDGQIPRNSRCCQASRSRAWPAVWTGSAPPV